MLELELSGIKVVLTVKGGGAVRYDFEALSKAKKPVAYSFTGTVETYLFEREDTGYVNFSYAKRDGGGAFRMATWSARERWSHVVKFIRSEVIPAVREYAKTDAYETAKLGAVRESLVRERQDAERNVNRCTRALEAGNDELAAAVAKLASFDERHGTAPE